jgi:hypothetical protein
MPEQDPRLQDRKRDGVKALRYQEEQGRYQDGDKDAEDGDDRDDAQPDEPDKPEKPELPNPMTEHALRETPDAIYHLEKAKLAADKGKTSGKKPSGRK